MDVQRGQETCPKLQTWQMAELQAILSDYKVYNVSIPAGLSSSPSDVLTECTFQKKKKKKEKRKETKISSWVAIWQSYEELLNSLLLQPILH